MDKSKIPFYASSLAQSFIDFELGEVGQENLIHDQQSISYMLKQGYSIDDLGLMDAVNILRAHDIEKARKAAALIQHPEGKASAERSIRCFQERCIR
ncbi:MAG: hypothetical protein AB1611_03230 [bacterium]